MLWKLALYVLLALPLRAPENVWDATHRFHDAYNAWVATYGGLQNGVSPVVEQRLWRESVTPAWHAVDRAVRSE